MTFRLTWSQVAAGGTLFFSAPGKRWMWAVYTEIRADSPLLAVVPAEVADARVHVIASRWISPDEETLFISGGTHYVFVSEMFDVETAKYVAESAEDMCQDLLESPEWDGRLPAEVWRGASSRYLRSRESSSA